MGDTKRTTATDNSYLTEVVTDRDVGAITLSKMTLVAVRSFVLWSTSHLQLCPLWNLFVVGLVRITVHLSEARAKNLVCLDR